MSSENPTPTTNPSPPHSPTTPASVFDPEAQTRRERSEDPDLREGQFAKTNPTEQSGTFSIDSAHERNVETNPTEYSGTLPTDSAHEQIVKTKPTEQSGTSDALSPRQLAAIRLLARGHGTTRAANRLSVTRQTIARWKRNATFAAELKRLTDALTETALRLRPGSRIHDFALYRAGVQPYRGRGSSSGGE
jgi:DNA-binding CsgD family transcriptional regulator